MRRGRVALACLLTGLLTFIGMPSARTAVTGHFFGVVSVDADADGVLDAVSSPARPGRDDVGLAGLEITLLDADGNVVATTVTDADGAWAFDEAQVPDQTARYRIEVDTASVPGAGRLYVASSASSDNALPTVPGSQQTGRSALLPGTGQRVDALVRPTWSLELGLSKRPDGSPDVSTGAGPFDDDDSVPGNDSSATNDRVRNGDVITYPFNLTASELVALGGGIDDTMFSQTITFDAGAVATFAEAPAACRSDLSVVALPSGESIAVSAAPPAGTTSLTLACNVGRMSSDIAVLEVLSVVKVLQNSLDGGQIRTTAQAYAGSPAATAVQSQVVTHGPVVATSTPRYNLEKLSLGFGERGTFRPDPSGPALDGIMAEYVIQMYAEKGSEPVGDTIDFDEYFANATDGSYTDAGPQVRWWLTECEPNSTRAGGGVIFGNRGPDSTPAQLETGVRATPCGFTRKAPVGDQTADNAPYAMTLGSAASPIDHSAAQAPVRHSTGTSRIDPDRRYLTSHRIKVFIPLEDVDLLDGSADFAGEIFGMNTVRDFEPTSVSGIPNHGTGREPGHCDPATRVDDVFVCDPMDDGKASDNQVESSYRYSPGEWGKHLRHYSGRAWSESSLGWPDQLSSAHGGDGWVQPEGGLVSVIDLDNGAAAASRTRFCDVFDSTVFELVPMRVVNDRYVDEGDLDVFLHRDDLDVAQQKASQAGWKVRYGRVDLSVDDPMAGEFDTARSRYPGTWSAQHSAADGVCGGAEGTITWYDSAAEARAAEGDVNVVVAEQLPTADPIPFGTQVSFYLPLQVRDTFFGGPHAGERIPEGVVLANYGNATNEYQRPDAAWAPNPYVPGAGPAGGATAESSATTGDRVTLQRARISIEKSTVAGDVDGTPAEGVARPGQTGVASAGAPVIWSLAPESFSESATPAPLHDVRVVDVLPPGITYLEAETREANGPDLPPPTAEILADGSTRLVWTLGEVVPNVPITPIKVVTLTDRLADNRTAYDNVVEVRAEEVVFRASAHRDRHVVQVTQVGRVLLDKEVDRGVDLQDGTQVHTLRMVNFTSTAVQAPTLYEVLPFVGDSGGAVAQRLPGSAYSGTTRLTGPPTAFARDGVTPRGGTFHYTSIPSASVPQHPADDTDPTIWSTTFSAAATGFKWVADAPMAPVVAGAEADGIAVVMETEQRGNDAGDFYANRFTAFSDSFVLEDGRLQTLTSPQVNVQVVGFSLGDRIWIDVDGDGRFDADVDRPAPAGTVVQVWGEDSSARPVATVTTDADGLWAVHGLSRGKYRAAIPASEFAAGGRLVGHTAATANSQADPDTDRDEADDHHAVSDAGGVRSRGWITLDADDSGAFAPIGAEPLGDEINGHTLPAWQSDAFTNFTLDLALRPVPGLTLAKSANPASSSVVLAGESVRYTVTATNTGATPLDPVTVSDDMSKVLAHVGDPATLDVDVALTPATGGTPPAVEFTTGEGWTWTGVLQKGQKATFTYEVTVSDDASGAVLTNLATATGRAPGGETVTPEPEGTTHPVPGYAFAKSADPASTTAVRVGDTITYTLKGHNSGPTPLDPVTITDDLSDVLGHAAWDPEALDVVVESDGSSVPAAVPAILEGTTLSWSGALGPGESVVITYRVTVAEGAEGEVLTNTAGSTVTPPGRDPQPSPEASVEHPVLGYEFAKTSDPASGSEVATGSTLTYTLNGVNTGATVLREVEIVDDLSGLTDHASVLEDSVEVRISSGRSAPEPTVADASLRWAGDLEIGESVTVTYRVRVHDDAHAVTLRNSAVSQATPPQVPEPVDPVIVPPRETEHRTPGADPDPGPDPGPDPDPGPGPGAEPTGAGDPGTPLLPDTGSPVTWGLLALTVSLVAGGCWLVARGRRLRRLG